MVANHTIKSATAYLMVGVIVHGIIAPQMLGDRQVFYSGQPEYLAYKGHGPDHFWHDLRAWFMRYFATAALPTTIVMIITVFFAILWARSPQLVRDMFFRSFSSRINHVQYHSAFKAGFDDNGQPVTHDSIVSTLLATDRHANVSNWFFSHNDKHACDRDYLKCLKWLDGVGKQAERRRAESAETFDGDRCIRKNSDPITAAEVAKAFEQAGVPTVENLQAAHFCPESIREEVQARHTIRKSLREKGLTMAEKLFGYHDDDAAFLSTDAKARKKEIVERARQDFSAFPTGPKRGEMHSNAATSTNMSHGQESTSSISGSKVADSSASSPPPQSPEGQRASTVKSSSVSSDEPNLERSRGIPLEQSDSEDIAEDIVDDALSSPQVIVDDLLSRAAQEHDEDDQARSASTIFEDESVSDAEAMVDRQLDAPPAAESAQQSDSASSEAEEDSTESLSQPASSSEQPGGTKCLDFSCF